ncbi:unnamed protein product [Nippostrongylus brasiliensis]|uniref:PAN domain protein n=1 Tax=Nippostrongylus brasiliensis TaxID=27835 RepID=A0A158R0F4_NIPBR|nr:unnamed protein product [Nippostrongylus brasiliensis]
MCCFSFSGAVCIGDNTTTYLRSEGTRLMEFATHTIKNVTLNMCASACTSRREGHECSSFEYDARSQECSMHTEDGQPFGPSVITKTDGPIAFFQQVCVKGDSLCSTPYGFERFPQSVLIGHAMEVLTTSSLSECLSRCLTAGATSQAQCRSVMFFYETGECIMNRERRTDKPDLFMEGVQDRLVDYFESNCHDVHCFTGQLHWIRTEDYFIIHEKDVVIESMGIDECRAVCQENLVGAEKFPCRAFVYNAAKKECHLTAESGYTGRRRNSFNLNPISNGEYFEKYCLQVPFTCLEASFEQVADRKMTTVPYKDLCSLSETSQFSHPELFVEAENNDYFDKICDPVPASKRHSGVSKGREPVVEGVTSIALDEDEALNDEDERTSLGLEDIDEVSRAVTFTDTSTSAIEVGQNVVGRKEAETIGTVVDDTADFQGEPSPAVKALTTMLVAGLTSECRMSGVTVKVEFASSTSGNLYIKENFANCRTEFNNASAVELHIPFPESDDPDPRCPGIEIAPSVWSFPIVVQRNDVSAPSVVTSVDRIFNVTCDYADLIDKEGSPIVPSDDPNDEAKSSRIEMQILRHGQPVTTVPLGEEVELRWKIVNQSSGLGYFVDNCAAERVGGTPPQPEPLQIIEHGCPDKRVENRLIKSPVVPVSDGFSTKMKVFRFDGSRRVRIRCTIDVCIESCAPVRIYSSISSNH